MKFSGQATVFTALPCFSSERYLDIFHCKPEVLRFFSPFLKYNYDFFFDVFP